MLWAAQQPQHAAQGSLAELTKLTRQSWQRADKQDIDKGVSWHEQSQSMVQCNLCWSFGQETAPDPTEMLPEAEVCFNLS